MRADAEGALRANLKVVISMGPRDGSPRALLVHRAMIDLFALLDAPMASVVYLERERGRRAERALSPAVQDRLLDPAASSTAARLSIASDVLTLAETAKLIRRSAKTTAKLVRSGALPGRKVGREWRFVRSAVLELLQFLESKHGDSRT